MKKKEKKEIEKINKAIDEIMSENVENTEENIEESSQNENDDFMPYENFPIENEIDEEVSNVETSEDEENSDSVEIPVSESTKEEVEGDESSDSNFNDMEMPSASEEVKPINGNNIYLSYNTRLLINVAGILLFAMIGLILLISSISIKARSNVLYRQTSNLDYKVYLKENDYYKDPYLNKNMQYIASLIDNIDVNFNYNFNANQNINYKYTYYIQADVSVANSEDKSKVIYSKTDKLTDPKVVTMSNSSGFNISENLKINYNEYNDLIKAFKSSYAINADSNLVLSLYLDVEDEKGNKIVNSNEAMKLTIPLTEQMVNISMDYKEVNNSNNVEIYKDFSIANKFTLVLSIISFIVTMFFIVRLLIFIKKTSAKKTIYDVTLSKILREYDRIIVNARKSFDMGKYMIDVNSFNELLDVRDNLEKPILFQEIHRGQKSIFVVKNGGESYRYILKLVDLEKEQNK